MCPLSREDLKRTIILDSGDDEWEINMRTLSRVLAKEGFRIEPIIPKKDND